MSLLGKFRNVCKETRFLAIVQMWGLINFFGYQREGRTQNAQKFRSTQITAAVKI